MPTLRNEAARKTLLERLGRVTPESKAQWGRFDAPRMMCHLGDALDEALGRHRPAPWVRDWARCCCATSRSSTWQSTWCPCRRERGSARAAGRGTWRLRDEPAAGGGGGRRDGGHATRQGSGSLPAGEHERCPLERTRLEAHRSPPAAVQLLAGTEEQGLTLACIQLGSYETGPNKDKSARGGYRSC